MVRGCKKVGNPWSSAFVYCHLHSMLSEYLCPKAITFSGADCNQTYHHPESFEAVRNQFQSWDQQNCHFQLKRYIFVYLKTISAKKNNSKLSFFFFFEFKMFKCYLLASQSVLHIQPLYKRLLISQNFLKITLKSYKL